MIDGATEEYAISLEKDYDISQAEGRMFVRRTWSALFESTRAALISTGCYTDRGERIGSDPSDASLEDMRDDLEYNLGVLKRCVSSDLPRPGAGTDIPSAAFSKGVVTAAEFLLSDRRWHDPVFLRLGLFAVCKHERARALEFAEPQNTSSGTPALVVAALRVILKLVFLVVTPISIAVGIAAAGRQNIEIASVAFLITSIGISVRKAKMTDSPQAKDRWTLAYDEWERLKYEDVYGRSLGVTGAAAWRTLQHIEGKGVKVPAVAFDLADTLRFRMNGGPMNDPANDR